MKCIGRKWMVYYINTEGYREGSEYIEASSREEAIETYKRYFNVQHAECKAVPVFGK